MKGGGIKTPDPDWSRNREGRSTVPSRQNSPPRVEPVPTVNPISRGRRGSRLPRQHSYDDEVKNNIGSTNQTETGLNLPPQMPRRASAYDVFSMPTSIISNTGLNRRASVRISATISPNITQGIEPSGATLGAPEEDRRTRRRGSQL